VPLALPPNNPLISQTSSGSTPYWELPGTPARHTISLPTVQLEPAAVSRRRDVAGIEDLAPLPHMLYDKFDAENEYHDSFNLGWAEGNAQVNLEHKEFYLNQFANWMAQRNITTVNQWMNVSVAGLPEKKNPSIISRQKRLTELL
jgi:hypothetical protein